MAEFVPCSTCGIDRLTSTLNEKGQCPFCIEEGVAPPAPEPRTSRIIVVPSKNTGARTKNTQEESPIPRAVRPEDQPVVDEAYTMPYTAPAFDHRKAEADPARELAMRELCRRHLLPFVQRFRPKYLAGWVHEDICRRLERFVKAVEAGASPRLLLLLPPRSGKSELGSRNFPPWVLGQHPDWEIIAASHTQSLTLSFSRYVRDLVRDQAYKAIFPALVLDPASQSIENWNTLQGGGYMAAGVGTGISGRGCFSRNTLLRSHTRSDLLPISNIRVGEMVYGYDHRTGLLKPVKIIAVSLTRTRRQLYAVEDIVCTEDHYFYNPIERAYTTAGALTTNMSLLRRAEGQGVENVSCLLLSEPSDPFEGEDLPQVRREESGPCVRVQKLSHETSTSRPQSDTDLHTLREGVRAQGSRAQGGKQQDWELGAVVLSLSQVVSHTRGVCARDIEAFVQDEDGELVVDIQTESHNFFVGVANLLVHNCHILVVDDVVKDAEAADSVTIRENTWEWYISTAYTRLAPGGGVLGILTWWHEDDWAGRIQEVMKSGEGDVFEVVKYPAINEDGDEYILQDDTIQQFSPESDPPPEGSRLTRLRGTAIHPDRYTTEMMLKIKNNLISSGLKRVWNALYQQNPVPDDGVYFTKEMLRWYTHPPRREEMFVYQAWDFAITEKTDSDWTVCATVGQDEQDNLYLLHILRFRSGDGNAIVDDVIDQFELFKPDLLGFEDGQIWKSLASQFKKRCDERGVYPNSELLQPLTDKKVRAGPLKGRMQIGKFFVRQNQQWTESFRQELMKFPSGKYDDQVDASAWAVRLTLTKVAPKKRVPKVEKSWKDKLNGLTGGDRGGHMAA